MVTQKLKNGKLQRKLLNIIIPLPGFTKPESMYSHSWEICGMNFEWLLVNAG